MVVKVEEEFLLAIEVISQVFMPCIDLLTSKLLKVRVRFPICR
jgi:hypothetical protein